MSSGIGILKLITVVRASAVAVSEDSPTFQSTATLVLLLSALMVYFGYRLIIKEIGFRRTVAKSNAKGEMNLPNPSISNAAPAVILAVLGCVGVVAALWQLGK